MHKKLLCIIFGTILLAGCWVPSAESTQKSQFDQRRTEGGDLQAPLISVPYVTLRNKTGQPAPSDYFGGNRGELRAGVCSVRFSPIWGVGDIAESVPFYIPDEKIELTSIQEVPLSDLSDGIQSQTTQNDGNLVFYVHGYNIDFEKSCRRTALFQRALGLQDKLLLFSWPADGNMLKYTWDESDLVWSVPHMAAFLEEVVSLTGNGGIDVVAHSLGARGVVQSLVRLSYKYGSDKLVDELILIAPDIDTGVFHQDLEKLSSIVGRITVYVSENDRALRLSEEVHGYPRLGQAGTNLTIFEGVETVDLSGISNRRLSGHLYHLFNPEVIGDLTELLHTGRPASQRSQLNQLFKDTLPYWFLTPDNPR